MAVIAIDGPAGAGKSTVARLVADSTGLPYLDTGAMYRCVAYAAQSRGVNIADPDAVGHLAESVRIVVNASSVVLDDLDISIDIRSPEISGIVSVIAAHSPVRDAMRSQQQAWISDRKGGVVEGRDIGTVVFPDADLKIFLTASPKIRAERRVAQHGGDVIEVAASISERDHLDSTREDSPLRPAEGAILVDSSDRSIQDVVNEIVTHFQKLQVESNG